jgi:hypothetical protein
MLFIRESAQRGPRLVFSAALVLLLSGCTVGPNYKRPAAPVPAKWDVSPPWREADPKDAVPKTTWWSLFHDDDLNGLETQLLAGNQNLAASIATLEQARATAAIQNATLFPTVGVGPTASGQRYSGNRATGSNIPLSGPVTQGNFTIPFSVSYEVDLVGKRRRTIEAAQAAYQANTADLENVRLVLTAELAADYFTLRQLDTEIAILHRTVQALQKGLDLVNSRHSGGVASGLDVAQEETLFNTTRTEATLLMQQRKQFEDAIAVLVGKPAPDFHLAPRELNIDPPNIDATIPSDVLERRPKWLLPMRRSALPRLPTIPRWFCLDKAAGIPQRFPSCSTPAAVFGPSARTWPRTSSVVEPCAPRCNIRKPVTTGRSLNTAARCSTLSAKCKTMSPACRFSIPPGNPRPTRSPPLAANWNWPIPVMSVGW